MKVYKGLSSEMLKNLKELADMFLYKYELEGGEGWTEVVNDRDKTILTQNVKKECYSLEFKRLVYNENYISGSIKFKVNDAYKYDVFKVDGAYKSEMNVIFERETGIADVFRFDSIETIYKGIQAFQALMYIDFEGYDRGIFLDNEDRIMSVIKNAADKLTCGFPFDTIEQLVDLISVCLLNVDHIEDVIEFISDPCTECLIDNMVAKKYKYKDINSEELAMRGLNCVKA